jgi:hypothetical protein
VLDLRRGNGSEMKFDEYFRIVNAYIGSTTLQCDDRRRSDIEFQESWFSVPHFMTLVKRYHASEMEKTY